MTTRRKILIAASAATLVAAFIAYASTVLRTCSEAHDIAKDAYEYRLCRFDGEFITKVPIAQPSTRSQPTAKIQQSLNAFLQSESFHFLRNEDGCEWWGDQQTELCITIDIDPTQNAANVEIVHVIP